MRERSGKDGERGRREGVGVGEKWERWGERKEGRGRCGREVGKMGREEGGKGVGEGEKWEIWGERKEGRGR